MQKGYNICDDFTPLPFPETCCSQIKKLCHCTSTFNLLCLGSEKLFALLLSPLLCAYPMYLQKKENEILYFNLRKQKILVLKKTRRNQPAAICLASLLSCHQLFMSSFELPHYFLVYSDFQFFSKPFCLRRNTPELANVC